MALEVDMAPALLPNGGANGNFEIASKANSSSVLIDPSIDFQEN